LIVVDSPSAEIELRLGSLTPGGLGNYLIRSFREAVVNVATIDKIDP